jgi:hypothetical protein
MKDVQQMKGAYTPQHKTPPKSRNVGFIRHMEKDEGRDVTQHDTKCGEHLPSGVD